MSRTLTFGTTIAVPRILSGPAFTQQRQPIA